MVVLPALVLGAALRRGVGVSPVGWQLSPVAWRRDPDRDPAESKTSTPIRSN